MEPLKDAWMYWYSIYPHCIGGPGIQANLFFSSPEKFHKLFGRDLDEYEGLVKVQVPVSFDDWDYIPNDY